MELDAVFAATVLLGILLLCGKLVCSRVSVLRKYYVPSSILGGLLGLALGPDVLAAAIK